MPPPPPRRSPRRWCFTWETLAHLPTLRLFLFTPSVRPSDRCTNLKASLRLDSSYLLVTWAEEGSGELSLCVPVPRVLIDPCSPVECVAREDHVEAKLTLVLPLDHPMSVNLRAALDAGGGAAGREDELSECPVPLSLGSDIKSLSAGDVHFYCRTCCARLTRRPQRNFVEMPSANWREVADNWFGSCCCSFGGASEKLVHEYIKAYGCSVATCILDGPSVIICKDNLDGFELQKCSIEQVDYSNMLDTVAKSEGICDATDSEVNFNDCGSPCFLPSNDGGLIDDHTEHSLNDDRKVTINADADLDSSADRVFPKDLVHCCVDVTHNLLNHAHGRPSDVSVAFSKMQPSTGNLSFPTRNLSHNGSLGSGFLIKTFNLSNEVQWVEFLCRQCSSFLGSYPIVMGVNSPVDGGIRLFKCYISTSMDVGGPHNLFKDGIRVKVGRGDTTLFWKDIWIEDSTLEQKFSAGFHLAAEPLQPVDSCCSIHTEQLVWFIRLRRNLKDEETEYDSFGLVTAG